MLLVDDDQAEVADRGEDRRARADADLRLAAAQALPLVEALAVGEGAVEDGEAVAEAGAEAGDGLRGEADLGDQDDRPAAAGERRLDRRQVDLGLARAGDAVEELLAGRVGLAVERRDEGVDGGLLLGEELRRVDRGGEAGGGGGAAHARIAGGDQAALGEPAQGRAVGADRGGQLRRRHLAALDQRLEHRPLLHPEPLAALQRRLAGGQDLGPQLGLRPHRAAGAAGPGPRRQHQREAARGRRAVLARHPEAELDQLRRGARLERLDRLREPLRRQLRGLGELDHDAEQPPRPERHPHQAADLEPLHRLRPAVVERPPQRAGSRQRLDLEDRHRGRGYGYRGTGAPARPGPIDKASANAAGSAYAAAREHEPQRGRDDHLPGAPLLARDPRLLPQRRRHRDRPRDHRQAGLQHDVGLHRRPRGPGADPAGRLHQTLGDDVLDHHPPPQHQARDHLAGDPGDAAGAGPERQLQPVGLPAGDADRRRRLRHRGERRRLRLHLLRRRRPGRAWSNGSTGRPARTSPGATGSASRRRLGSRAGSRGLRGRSLGREPFRMRLGQAEAAYGMALRVAASRSLAQVRADPAEDVGHLVRCVGDLPVGEAEDPEAGGGVGLVSLCACGPVGTGCGGSAGRRSRRPGRGRGSRSRPRSRGPSCFVSGTGRPAASARGRKRTSRSESESRKVWRSSSVASFFTPGSPCGRRAPGGASPGRRGRACPPR